MSEVSRSPWGEEPTPSSEKQNRPSTIRIILALSSGLLATVIARALLDVMNVTAAVRAGAPEAEIGVARWALAVILGAIAEVVVAFSPLLPMSSAAKWGRIYRVIVLFLATGIALAAITYLVMGFLVPDSTQSERLVLPTLIAIFFGILAVFSPVTPIWPVNVPDNQVWMILDNNDHLVRYVPAGVHMIRPLQGYAPYREAGVLAINIDDDSFVSSDAFPYRVRANIVCTYSPLKADPGMWVMLRDMKKDVLKGILQTDTEYIIRHAVSRYVREGINLAKTLNTIAMDIKEAFKARANFGVVLTPQNPINIILDPPEMVVDARQRRMSVEALALPGAGSKQPLKELLKLISADSDLNMNVNAEGQINFALTPGNDIEIGASLEKAIIDAASVLRVLSPRSMPAMPLSAQPLAIPPDLSETQPIPTPTTAEKSEQAPAQAEPAAPAQAEPVHIPANPLEPKKKGEDEVIDTDVDAHGVYIPRNPMGPKRPD
jgi:hypothetical protein